MRSIVIVTGGLHVGYVGCYGNEWIRTPFLDSLASQSVVFDQCFVESPQPLCVHRSWWTGRYTTPSSSEFDHLPNRLPVFEQLREAHVRTGFVSDHWLLREASTQIEASFDEAIWIRGQGYDSYVPAGAVEVSSAEWSRWWQPAHDDPRYSAWKSRFEQYLRNRSRITDERATPLARVIDTGTQWIERRRPEEPFLLWLECSDPHAPWGPPEPYLDLYRSVDDETDELTPIAADPLPGVVGESISEDELDAFRRTYAADVTFLDAWLGEFFERLDRHGFLDDCLVLVLSGHGVALGEHDTVGYARDRVLEEMSHVPLFLRLPGGQRGGTRSQALVQSPDVGATLLDAFGQAGEPGYRKLHGSSLLPLARGERAKLRDYAVSWVRATTDESAQWEEWSLRTHGWHLVLPRRLAADSATAGRRLFIKPEDRWDHNDVSDQYPAAAAQLELVLRRFESGGGE